MNEKRKKKKTEKQFEYNSFNRNYFFLCWTFRVDETEGLA